VGSNPAIPTKSLASLGAWSVWRLQAPRDALRASRWGTNPAILEPALGAAGQQPDYRT
jgi:hypothetical protein